MSNYFKNWLKAAGIRAVKTVAQTAVATIGTSAVLGDVNWIMVASASALAGILKEVIQGRWGNGAERKEKLTAAGYDYATVQKRVNEMLA